MDLETIRRLEPHYAREAGFGEVPEYKDLHDVTLVLHERADAVGEDVILELKELALYDSILEFLGLDVAQRALMSARLLPVHALIDTNNPALGHCRFLVVEAPHPLYNADDRQPELIRACFLLLGREAFPVSPSEIFPFFIVSETEVVTDGYPPEVWRSHVMYARVFGDPLADAAPPQRVIDPRAYVELKKEMDLAIARSFGVSAPS